MGNREGRWIMWGIVAVGVLVLLCTCCIIGLFLAGTIFEDDVSPVFEPTPQVDVPGRPDSIIEPRDPIPDAPLTDAPVPDEAQETLKALQEAEIPDADLHELGVRFLGVDPATRRVASTTPSDYPIGTVRTFVVSDVDTDQQFEIDAVLEYKTEHVYMWVEEGKGFNERRLQQAADLFEEVTYPTNREFFGSEWSPGVDGDPHLSILHAGGLGHTVAGYFSSPDQYVRAVREDSNEMEMFYVNIDNVQIGEEFYNGVLAHEFQHMIHWYQDRNEETWLNEGFSELATVLNERRSPGNYDVGGSEIAYLREPDTQLTTWPEGTAGDASAHYGASYLFTSYFLGRFGDEATQAVVSHDENGMDSVDEILMEELGLDYTHEEFFADWVVANLIDDTEFEGGRYGYADLDFYDPRLDVSYQSVTDPQERGSLVAQYGVDYVEVEGDEPLDFTFTGSTQTSLFDAQAHSGDYLWWSNRADESDSRLTRVVDLSDAEEALVEFWTWYHIEEDWDYAYLTVGTTEAGVLPADLSSDEVQWTVLDDEELGCTYSNPNGNAFGCGFTGTSSGWEKRSADLSPYAGQEIALRFEYITDAAVNQPGFAVDDVRVTVDGTVIFQDDAEEEVEGWVAEGFVRLANVLPQEWIVQVVTFDGEEPVSVERLLVGEGHEGSWVLYFDDRRDRAVITISAVAPLTTEPAAYAFTLSPAP